MAGFYAVTTGWQRRPDGGAVIAALAMTGERPMPTSVRRLLLCLLAGMALALLAALTLFPTEALVRRALDGLALPDGRRLEFAAARLRPWGLVLDDLVLRRADGVEQLRLSWLRVRPAVLGFLTGRRGFPWNVAAGLCEGRVDLRLAADGPLRELSVRAAGLSLAACLPATAATAPPVGRIGGTAELRLPSDPGRTTSGAGTIVLEDGSWAPPIAALERAVLHVDRGTTQWVLADDVLRIETLDVRGPELAVRARGDVRLRRPLHESLLRLQVELTPMPGLPASLRRLVAGLPQPSRDGARALVLSGPLRAPRLEPP